MRKFFVELVEHFGFNIAKFYPIKGQGGPNFEQDT